MWVLQDIVTQYVIGIVLCAYHFRNLESNT